MPDDKKTGFSRDSISNTLIVAIGISLVCSVLVSSAAIVLRPLQEANQNEFRQRIVLEVAGLYEPGVPVDQQFSSIETRLVDLETGEYIKDVDPQSFDAEAAANDPKLGVGIPKEQDIAKLGRRAVYAPVYVVKEGDEPQQYILPVQPADRGRARIGPARARCHPPGGRPVRGHPDRQRRDQPGPVLDRLARLRPLPGKNFKRGE